MPQFPPKSVVCKSPGPRPTPQLYHSADMKGIARFRPRFLERRKQGLSYFLKFVVDLHASNISTNLFLAASCSTPNSQDRQSSKNFCSRDCHERVPWKPCFCVLIVEAQVGVWYRPQLGLDTGAAKVGFRCGTVFHLRRLTSSTYNV